MKNLMSMCDFVLEQVKNSKYEEFNKVNEIFVNKVVEYANFLKQPLELWMFVPCDEDGNVLEEPIYYQMFIKQQRELFSQEDYNICKEYQQAKERCLFEGFEYQQAQQEDHYSLIRFPDRRTTPLYLKLWIGMTIEDLVKYNLTLTKTAIKQIS